MILALAVGLLGLLIGSFLNVVIARVPAGRSIVSPPSACPACGAAVRPRDNVPLVSWLLLRGRCRDCRAPVSVRYPLVELGTAVLFAVLALRLGPDPVLPTYLYAGAVGVALAVIDVDVRRLPDALTLPSYPVIAVGLGAAALLGADGSWVRALLGGLVLFSFYFALFFAYPSGMGFGDVKLAGLLGMLLGWFGWSEVVVGGFLGFLLGGVFGVGLILLRRGGRKSTVPFGPFMLAGALLAVLAGGSLADAYLELTLG